MPEFSSFLQWLGWFLIVVVVCATAESILTEWARAWGRRKGEGK